MSFQYSILGQWISIYERRRLDPLPHTIYKSERTLEVKNKLTVTTGDVGGDNEGKGGREVRNMYKGHMDKTKGG